MAEGDVSFGAESLLEVTVDQSSLQDARETIEAEVNDATVNVDAAMPDGGVDMGAAGASGGTAMGSIELDEERNEYLLTQIELLEELVDTTETAGRSGGPLSGLRDVGSAASGVGGFVLGKTGLDAGAAGVASQAGRIAGGARAAASAGARTLGSGVGFPALAPSLIENSPNLPDSGDFQAPGSPLGPSTAALTGGAGGSLPSAGTLAAGAAEGLDIEPISLTPGDLIDSTVAMAPKDILGTTDGVVDLDVSDILGTTDGAVTLGPDDLISSPISVTLQDLIDELSGGDTLTPNQTDQPTQSVIDDIEAVADIDVSADVPVRDLKRKVESAVSSEIKNVDIRSIVRDVLQKELGP